MANVHTRAHSQPVQAAHRGFVLRVYPRHGGADGLAAVGHKEHAGGVELRPPDKLAPEALGTPLAHERAEGCSDCRHPQLGPGLLCAPVCDGTPSRLPGSRRVSRRRLGQRQVQGLQARELEPQLSRVRHRAVVERVKPSHCEVLTLEHGSRWSTPSTRREGGAHYHGDSAHRSVRACIATIPVPTACGAPCFPPLSAIQPLRQARAWIAPYGRA